MKFGKIDNPWLIWVLPLLSSVYGFVAGWIFGPILYPAPVRIPDTDFYTYGFQRNIAGAIVGLIGGFILAVVMVYQLHRTANIKIPDETLGHSDDPELDAINGFRPNFPEEESASEHPSY